MKNKNKGFTIVELVIVIAVVAVLAAVVIPTFAAIVKNANISADTQALRNMNIILTAECADSPAPADVAAVIALLKENGITDLTPQTRFYTFFWVEDDNVIILADEGDRPVYPEEYLGKQFTSSWYALDEAEALPIPTRPESSEGAQEPQIFTVSVTQSGSSVIIPFENIPTQAKEGEEFRAEICLPEALREDPELCRYAIKKVTAIMRDGETEHKFVVRSERAEETGYDYHFGAEDTAVLEIPCVTGNIEINIDVTDYCIVTITGDEHFTRPQIIHKMRRTSEYSIISDSLSKMFLEEGYKIKSAIATQNGKSLGDLYDEESGYIKIDRKLLTSDIEIYIETEPINPTEPTE